MVFDLVEVVGLVLVGDVGGRDVKFEVGSVVLEVVVVGQFVGDLGAEGDGGLVGPAAGDVSDGVAAAAEEEEREAVGLEELDAAPVSLEGEIEAAEAVAGEGVGAALEDDGGGLVGLHDFLHDGLEDGLVGVVVDAVADGEVDGVVLAAAGADVLEVAGAGEVLAVLVEGDGHDAVGGVEGLLDAVSVVDVDVDVEDALVVLEELEDGEHDVVDVAEAGRLALLGVVESAGPVDGDVRLSLVQFHGAGHTAAGGELAELVESVKDGAVLADVEALHLSVVLAHVVGSNVAQEHDVLVGVILGHLLEDGLVGSVDLHLAVESVVEEKIVGHADAMGLHRMSLSVVVIADVTIVVVADPRLAVCRGGHFDSRHKWGLPPLASAKVPKLMAAHNSAAAASDTNSPCGTNACAPAQNSVNRIHLYSQLTCASTWYEYSYVTAY